MHTLGNIGIFVLSNIVYLILPFLETSWFELIEDFAATTLAVIPELSLGSSRVNVSGARLLLTLILSLRRKNEELGIVSLCIGGRDGNCGGRPYTMRGFSFQVPCGRCRLRPHPGA